MVRITALITLILITSCSVEVGPPLMTDLYSPTTVYFGNKIKYTKPAEITSLLVFKHIPEYKRILSENLTPHDAEYYLLLGKSCDVFYYHINTLAIQKNLDLIVEKGIMSFTRPAIDITKDVLDRLANK